MKIASLTITCIICVLTVVVINFNIPIHLNIDDKSTTLISAILLSYISAYIFHLFNVYLVYKKKKKNIMPYLSNQINFIITTNNSIILYLDKKDWYRKYEPYYPSPKEFKNLLKIDIQEILTTGYSYADLFTKVQKETLDHLNSLTIFNEFIDEDLRAIIYWISKQSFLERDFHSLENSNMKLHINAFYRYFSALKDLNEYHQKHLSKYSRVFTKKLIKKTNPDIYDIILEEPIE